MGWWLFALLLDVHSAASAVDPVRVDRAGQTDYQDGRMLEAGECADSASDCTKWAEAGECSTNADYMRDGGERRRRRRGGAAADRGADNGSNLRQAAACCGSSCCGCGCSAAADCGYDFSDHPARPPRPARPPLPACPPVRPPARPPIPITISHTFI